MTRRRLDYCLYHRRVQIALDPQYYPCLRAHLYAHRYGLVSRLPAFACFPVCQHRFRKTVISTHQLKELSGFPFTGLSLGVSAFTVIKLPLRYPNFFQSALVGDSMLLAVLNYLCNFFSCKHFFVRRYLAWNKFATRTSPVAYVFGKRKKLLNTFSSLKETDGHTCGPCDGKYKTCMSFP